MSNQVYPQNAQVAQTAQTAPAVDPNDPYKKYKDFKWENPDAFRNGPIDDESRKCRDCVCCIIFILILILGIIVSAFGFIKGTPSKFFYFYDENGKACGHDDGYEKYPYLYFTSVISGLKNFDSNKLINAVCVSSCPNKTLDPLTEATYRLDCQYQNDSCLIDRENYYESRIFLDRICFPKSNDEKNFDEDKQTLVKIYDPDTGDTFEKVVNNEDTTRDENGRVYIAQDIINGENDPEKASAKLINLSYFTQLFTLWINDLNTTKYAILASIGWSFILAMLYFVFLRCCAGFITFMIILIVEAGLVVLAVYFYFLSKDEEEIAAEADTTDYAFFWLFTSLAVIWLLFILIMCNRIRLAVALTEVTSKYINKTCYIVFVPFLFFIILVIWLAYWIVLLVFLYASGEFQEDSKIFASFKMDEKLEYGFWFHIVMLFYITAIITAYSQFVYASSACIWYFTSEKGTENHPIAKSFERGIRYHFGSLVFGATIITIIRCIMLAVEVIKKKMEKSVGKTQGKFIKCLFGCIQCCLGCCNKIMEYINKHAYIQIALKGDSFCTAAFEGFGLIIRNLGRFSALALIGGIFSIVGILFITVASGIIGYFLITKIDAFSEDLNSCVLPVVCFCIIGFVMGRVSMNIFSISGDALIHSFLLDEEINKGQPKAFPELQKFMSDER